MGLCYIKNLYKDDLFCTFLKVCLIGFIVWYITKQKYNIGTNEIVLLEKEIDKLVDEWKPEPLVPVLTEFECKTLDKVVMIDEPNAHTTGGPNSTKVCLASGTNNKPELNFVLYNFLGFLDSPELGKHAVKSLCKYGMGSCSLPGFYSTLDMHMELEKQIAAFIGHLSAILYSQVFTTTLLVIPCFSKCSNIIVADEGVNFAVQKAIYLLCSKVYWYKHNDMADLECILKDVNKQLVGCCGKNTLPHKFIVTEGLFQTTGDIMLLAELVELKHCYKYHIILDESYLFGMLGKHGAGLMDYFNIDPHEVDLLIGALCYAVGASGGFCCADKDLVEHQRLSGLGYCFSASMPGILTIVAADAIQVLEVDPDNYLGTMHENTTLLCTLLKHIPGLQVDGVAESLLIHIHLSLEMLVHMKHLGGMWTKADIDHVLIVLSEEALKDSMLLMHATYVDEHECLLPNSSICICVSSAHMHKEIK
ncbi:serine palmitoyltransferase component [Coemansia sp. RSA 2131]|nr:serine palmitoyltransferase component [Coemansia sp. RSA 2131]